MELTEEIVALLESKFQGMRKDVAQNLASVLALQVSDKDGAQRIVDRLTAEKIAQFGQSFRSNIDKEIQQSNKTYEENLRKKFDFKEKSKEEKTEPTTGGALTLETIKALFAEQLNPLTQRMDALDAQKLGATRREIYVGKLKDAKLSEAQVEMLTQQFDRMSFKDEADFNSFLSTSQPQISKLAQETMNQSLRADRTPSMGRKNENGISDAVQDFIKSQNEPKENPMAGKSFNV